MSVTFINLNRTFNTDATITVTKPTNTADGDVMFAVVSGASYSTGTPAGWTKIAENYDGSNNRRQLFYKVAASEGSDYTWSGFNGVNYHMITVLTYRITDIGGGTLINAYSNSAYTTADTILRGGSLTTTRNTALFFFGIININTSVTATKPTVPSDSWTEDLDSWQATPDVNHIVYSMTWTSLGATGNIDSTISTSTGSKHVFVVGIDLVTSFLDTQTDTIEINDSNPVGIGFTATDTIEVADSGDSERKIITNQAKHIAVITNQPKS